MALEEHIPFIFGGAIFGLVAIVLAVLFLASYIYFSYAWHTIGTKLKHKNPWIAWIPFAKTILQLQLGDFHWAFVFLYLIPVLGWIALLILTLIAKWRIFEKRHYPGWLSLILLIPQVGFIGNAIIIGLVAWYKK